METLIPILSFRRPAGSRTLASATTSSMSAAECRNGDQLWPHASGLCQHLSLGLSSTIGVSCSGARTTSERRNLRVLCMRCIRRGARCARFVRIMTEQNYRRPKGGPFRTLLCFNTDLGRGCRRCLASDGGDSRAKPSEKRGSRAHRTCVRGRTPKDASIQRIRDRSHSLDP